jgi:hypothetical protein
MNRLFTIPALTVAVASAYSHFLGFITSNLPIVMAVATFV